MNKKGQSGWVIALLVIIAAGITATTLALTGVIGGEAFSIGGDEDKEDIPIASLYGTHINELSRATEGSNDLEFWELGANINDATLTPKETCTLASGALNDTTINLLSSGMTEKNMDLYLEGAGDYYDHKITEWYFKFNPNTGQANLVVEGDDGGSVSSYDVGTFADIDTPEALDTGFVDITGGVINYSIAAGDGTVYMDLELGNDETDSKLEDMVLCVGDDDADLEGNELAGLTVALKDGSSIGSVPSNILTLFSDSAGTGSMVCSPIGDVVGLIKGTYRFTFEITEANFADGEEFEIGVDDLGGWKSRQEPSGNLKAASEDVQIVRGP